MGQSIEAQDRSELHTLGAASKTNALSNGIRIETTSGGVEEITALEDDVVRIRASATHELAEDASWSVLSSARETQAGMTRDDREDSVGFRTKTLRLAVSRTNLCLSILDRNENVLQKDAAPLRFEGSSFRILKQMPADEHYFGLGDKIGPIDRRGHAYSMWNTDAYRFQESTDPLYKSIPFFMTFKAGRAVGVFLDNTARTSFDFGKESPSRYSFGSVSGPVDYYVFLGPSPREVLEKYAWLTGKPPLPPRWMLGFQQSRFTYTPESRLMEIAERLRADRIPSDVLYLDIDFQDRNRPFTVNRETFPDLEKALAKLHEERFHVVAITDLHIADVTDGTYAPYSSGAAGNHFLHNPDGSVYIGSVWPGPAVFPDFTQQSTRMWWGGLYKNFRSMGFDGFWNDMNEPSIFNSATNTIPESVVHRINEPGFQTRTAAHAEIHNVYGMENSRATYEGLLNLSPDTRPFVLTRATYAGGQRYAATWTGDDSSTWNHLRESTPMLKSLALSGFSYGGADVGGFAGTAKPDLITKWIELAAFEPIDRDHSERGTGDKEPWAGGDQHERIRRHFIEERYRLMPYIYTLAEESARTGLPMMRPLFLDYPNATRDKHPIDNDPGVDAEFLLGHDLLIAPSPYPEAPDDYTVEFPSANWYDYWTGERVPPTVPNTHPDPNAPPAATELVSLARQVHPALDALPVWVRAGAIVPMQPLVQSTEETPQGPLTLRVYAGDDCRGELYTDDGKSFAYREGRYLRISFSCSLINNRFQISVSRHEGNFVPWWKELRVEIYGWKPARNLVQIDGKDSRRKIESGKNFVALTVPDVESGSLIDLE